MCLPRLSSSNQSRLQKAEKLLSDQPAKSLFIADLHLDPENEDTQALALRFLQFAQGHEQLFILGDLFEYWVGDDAGIPMYASFIAALKELQMTGCHITVMHGNRDFLLGDAFAENTGASLIGSDEHVVLLGKSPVLLMHGDTLCIGDVDYQHFRSKVREPQWQAQFLSKSPEERHEQAQALRAASADASASKSSSIMDVSAEPVLMRMQFHGCQTLIHGHTHRPARNTVSGGDGVRWVVGDWHADHAQYVCWDGSELTLETFV